ncbi:MAG TPA: hypothetical protein EYQ53_05775 [Candidatus Poseidoniales archaeon]|nr:MAG: hypothetical protein CXT69_01330 [Euryarchaeota archaeon]HIG03870.1 hypothetical protein [Candidatus Poseidoniales archaeon]HIK79055.1 hypothetical protein [Candidatus Poseidoniales archaeon]
MLRKIIYRKRGGLDSIDVVDCDSPSPKSDEILIEVHKAGINFADLMMRQGLYGAAPDFPFTPGYEVAGIVLECGEGIKGIEIGDRVVAMTNFGGYSQQVVVQENQAWVLPDEVSFASAAAMPVAYVTAFHMLSYLGNFQVGNSVLIHHAAGGVGTAVSQIANLLGASVVVGTSSSGKKEFVENQGMIHVSKEEGDFVKVCKEKTGGKGVDHALDPVGGKHVMLSYKALCTGGRLYVFGASSASPKIRTSWLAAYRMWRQTPRFDPIKMMNSNKSVFGIHMGMWDDKEVLKQHMIKLAQWLKEGKINPIIDSTFHFEDVAAAQKHIHDRKNKGKVLLDFSP